MPGDMVRGFFWVWNITGRPAQSVYFWWIPTRLLVCPAGQHLCVFDSCFLLLMAKLDKKHGVEEED
jgi:hypothetical protein